MYIFSHFTTEMKKMTWKKRENSFYWRIKDDELVLVVRCRTWILQIYRLVLSFDLVRFYLLGERRSATRLKTGPAGTRDLYRSNPTRSFPDRAPIVSWKTTIWFLYMIFIIRFKRMWAVNNSRGENILMLTKIFYWKFNNEMW